MSTFCLPNEHAMSESRGRSLARPGAGPDVLSTAHESKDHQKMPPAGLLHLRTRAENRAQTDTIQVWMIELPAKAANNALRYMAILRVSEPGHHDDDIRC